MSDALKAQMQSMAGGESFTDTFTYAIKLGNGTLSWATASVKISGVNDIALMSGNQSGAVVEDRTSTASGTLTVVDADHDQSHTQQVVASAHNSDAGLGSVGVDADGHWNYQVDQALIQHLAAGVHATDTFTVKSFDGTAEKVVTVDIVGVNDVAVITGDDTGAVTEDGAPSASGTLAVSDVDDYESAFAGTSDLNGDHGTWTFDLGTGAWGYALNNGDPAVQGLNAGDSVFETLTVSSVDGTEHPISVAINGADEPVTPDQIFDVGAFHREFARAALAV